MAESRFTEEQIRLGNLAMSLSPFERNRQLSGDQLEVIRQMLEENILTVSGRDSDLSFQASRPNLVRREEIEKDPEEFSFTKEIFGIGSSIEERGRSPFHREVESPLDPEKDKLTPSSLRRDMGRIWGSITLSPIVREWITGPAMERRYKSTTKPNLRERTMAFLKGEEVETEQEKLERDKAAKIFGQFMAEKVLPFNVDQTYGITRDRENKIKYSFFGLKEEDLEAMRNETGEIQTKWEDFETNVGVVGYIGSFFVGFSKLRGLESIKNLKPFKSKSGDFQKAADFTSKSR